MRARRNLAENGATQQNVFVKLLVFFGIANVDARPQDADGPAFHSDGALMCDGVNATRQSADDHDAAGGQFAGEAVGHLRAVQRRAARADNGKAGNIQDLCVAANVQQDRRIVNLKQCLGIFHLGPVDQMRSWNRSQRRQLLLRRLNASFLTTACAVAAGNSQASSCFGEALNTASGEPKCLSERADKRAAMPFVKDNASQDKAVSSCTFRKPRAERLVVG
jgi:hypothetical protein